MPGNGKDSRAEDLLREAGANMYDEETIVIGYEKDIFQLLR